MKKAKCKICKQENGNMIKGVCKDCYNIKTFRNENYSKLIDYLKKKFNNFSVHGNILRQIKGLRNEGLTDKQILYIIYYTFDILKLFNMKYNYTIALCMNNGGDTLEHAKKKNIDLINIKKDYFQEEINKNNKLQEERKKEISINRIDIKKKQQEDEISKIQEQIDKLKRDKEKEELLEKRRIEWENTIVTKISELQLENYLIDNLHLIEDGLIFIKNQYQIERGVIDILAKDRDNNDCIIELKIDDDDKRIVWQCGYYPTQINDGKCRMITVAPNYAPRIMSALHNFKYVEMFTYDVKFGTNIKPIKSLSINKVINNIINEASK